MSEVRGFIPTSSKLTIQSAFYLPILYDPLYQFRRAIQRYKGKTEGKQASLDLLGLQHLALALTDISQ